MAFNAVDNWDIPAAAVIAAEEAVRIRPGHDAPNEANPGAILAAAVLQHEIRALGDLLQPVDVAAAAAAVAAGLPAPQRNLQVPRPGQASLPTFSDSSADGWFLFRRAYTVCCQINNWDDLRSRRQLLLALKDGALAKIANLQPTPDPEPVDWNLEAFLDQIEGKFVHQVDTFRARAEYTQARQLKEEDVGTWHTRILQLHTRAWHGAVDREVSHELIYKFCCGLYHPMMRAKTVESNPVTFGEALEGAMQAEASQMMLAAGLFGTRGAGGPANNAMINAMGSPGGGYVEMRECHTCHQVGHLARNCPKGSAPASGAKPAKKGGNFGKKKKAGGDQKGQKPRANTGSYGPVQKARVGAIGDSDPCDGQLHGEGN
jgi:hypothetical protein